MIVVNNENTVFFDVDDTLISTTMEGDNVVTIEDVIEEKVIRAITLDANIRLLKEEKHKGQYIVVWSRGGAYWAQAVIKALDLKNYVDLVIAKPLAYVDDKDVKEWLPYRVWLSNETNYKKSIG